MMVDLPVPIMCENEKITQCELKKPTTGVVMETKKSVDTSGYFVGLKKFLEGTTNLTPIQINMMPYQTAEYLSIKIMLLEYPDDTGVEGLYTCPRCQTDLICEEKDGIDTRDHIDSLPIEYDLDVNLIVEDVDIDIIDKKTSSLILHITSLAMRYPQMKDFIEASAKVGYTQPAAIQKEVYKKCIARVNHNEDKLKQIINLYGETIINKMSISKLNKFAEKIEAVGLQTTVQKNCIRCGKLWKTKINTANFFVSALL